MTLTEATRKIERYCAYQERCHKEVVEKLHSYGMIPQAVDHIMGHLIHHDFVNEERYARAFVRGKFTQKKWGRIRIKSELKARGITEFNLRTAMKEITDQAYLETLEKLVEKRLAQLKGERGNTLKRKLADYLLYRGWESHLVYEKVRELG